MEKVYTTKNAGLGAHPFQSLKEKDPKLREGEAFESSWLSL